MSEPHNVSGVTTLQAAVAGYIAELNRQGQFSTSHGTLHSLYRLYGRDAVDAELEPYFAKERAERAARDAEIVREFYASYGLTPDGKPLSEARP